MEEMTTTVPTVHELLQASAATAEFATALTEFAEAGHTNGRIRFAPGNPPVKVLRAICGLLEHAPDLTVDKVEVAGFSGCSDYRGTLIVNGGEKRFEFVWDCAWRAQQAGLRDFFGDPDQARAARTFGYRCFQRFEETSD